PTYWTGQWLQNLPLFWSCILEFIQQKMLHIAVQAECQARSSQTRCGCRCRRATSAEHSPNHRSAGSTLSSVLARGALPLHHPLPLHNPSRQMVTNVLESQRATTANGGTIFVIVGLQQLVA